MRINGSVRRLALRAAEKKPWLTRQRLAVFGVTLIAVGIALQGLDTGVDATGDSDVAVASIVSLDLPPPGPFEDLPQNDRLSAGMPLDADSGDWVKVTVRSGQTLGGIFTQQGFSASMLHDVVNLNDNTRKLKKIRPGELFEFRKDESGEFLKMRYGLNESQNLIVSNEGGTLNSELIEREISTRVTEAEGIISSSLFLAAKEAGLGDAMTMEMANIFGWDIDFVFDIREGDRFFVVYEKLYRDGQYLRDGDILAATFISQGERYRAVRFDSDHGADYFDPDGRNMRREFLRAPLNFSYISSGFNPRRMHPILKRIRPHNGIDYYAPQGTPVYAAGDGTVIRSAYSNANGNHVFIQHSNSIVTKYLHFTKRAVREGQKVRQGQTIGYVGSTGLASGPHLHYEFVVNGVHRNPRTVPLPEVVPLEGTTLAEFQRNAAPMLTRLSRLESASLYASAE
jgi:murein DD-endopeptidase MepM/ murein hydrolase activator NlpD